MKLQLLTRSASLITPLLLAAASAQAQVVATSDFTGITGGAGTDSITSAPNWGLAKDLYGASFGTVDVVNEELSLTHTDTFPPLVYQADWRWYFGLAAGANAPDNNDVFIVRFDHRVDTLSNNFEYRPAIFMHILDDSWPALVPVGAQQPPIGEIDRPGQQSAMFRMNDGSNNPSPPDNPLPSDGLVGLSGWGTDIDFEGNFDNPPVPAGETATVELLVNRSGSAFMYEGQSVSSGSFGVFTKTAGGGPLPGNYDGNNVVDGADYDAWRAAFGSSTAPGSGADGNGDGVVDAADYVIWRKFEGTTGGGTTVYGGERFIDSTGTLTTLRMVTYTHGWVGAFDNFEVEILVDTPGSGSGAASSIGAVPEPGTVMLCGCALAMLLLRRRQSPHALRVG